MHPGRLVHMHSQSLEKWLLPLSLSLKSEPRASMARFLVALFAATVIAVQAGQQLGDAAPSTAEVFWRAVLPESPLPDAVLRLLRPDTNILDKPEAEGASSRQLNYLDYKRSSGDLDYGKGSGKRLRAAAGPPFDYQDYGVVVAEKRRGATAGVLDYSNGLSKRADGSRSGEPAPGKSLGSAAGPPFDYNDYSGAENRRGATAGELDYSKGSSKRAAGGGDGGPAPGERLASATAGAGDFDYKDYSGAGAGELEPFGYDYRRSQKRRGAAVAGEPFGYDYKAPSKSHTGSGASDEASRARAGGAATTTTIFFHEEAVRVGERLPFRFPPAVTTELGLLPRHVADTIPFSTAALPGVLALFGVAPDSAVAASMEETLRTCETPTLAGETKFCATSLEALVERAMAVLGTRDVRAVTSTLPRAGAPLQPYNVRAVRPVEGGSRFVACHDEAYPYTVYRCHTTGPARAYMVEMEGARGGVGAVTVATVCHTDTSKWNPEHVSFKLLGTKPGGAPVCHLMPYGHIIWAKNVKRSPA